MKRRVLKAIRTFCVDCQGGSHKGVRECEDADCALHDCRMGENCGDERPLRVVRRHCMACTGNSRHEVRTCPDKEHCPLWPYRIGVTPKALQKCEARRRNTPLLLPGITLK